MTDRTDVSVPACGAERQTEPQDSPQRRAFLIGQTGHETHQRYSSEEHPVNNIKFVSFDKIRRAEAPLLNDLIREGLGDTPCVVQEKIHGANFSLWTNGDVCRAAKRTAMIKPREDFFGGHQIRRAHTDRLFALFHTLSTTFPGLKTLAVFGELYGGLYPHPAMSPIPDLKPVQNGVYYRPDLGFCTFDVLINAKRWLPTDQATEVLRAHGFDVAQTLYAGTLSRCALYPVEFAPTIPATLGLPPIEDNRAEGVIIRSRVSLPNRGRLLLKKKSAAWQETNPRHSRRRSRSGHRALSAAAAEILDEGIALICANRLRNVISRIGTIRVSDRRQLCRALIRDARDELGTETICALPNPEQRRVDLVLRQSAEALIDAHFLAIVEGDF